MACEEVVLCVGETLAAHLRSGPASAAARPGRLGMPRLRSVPVGLPVSIGGEEDLGRLRTAPAIHGTPAGRSPRTNASTSARLSLGWARE